MDRIIEKITQLIRKAEEQYLEKYLILIIPSLFSKNFITYCAMKAEFELILKYIEELKNKPSDVLKSALTYSIIALYGKCFTDASKSSLPKLEPANLFQKGGLHYTTHEYLMHLRHNFIAHRGKTENELGIAYMLIPRGELLDSTEIRFNHLRMQGFPEKDLEDIENLVNYIIIQLVEKIQKTGQKMHDGMLSKFTPTQLAIMAINKESQ